MTYNFDPERWYDNEYAALEAKRRQKTIGDDVFRKNLDELEQRYEEMLQRLDGIEMKALYRVSGTNDSLKPNPGRRREK